jgi:protease IV
LRKFLIGILVGIAVTIFGLLLLVFTAGRLLSNKQPVIAGNSVLVMSLEGDLAEASSVDFSLPFLQSRPPVSVRDVWAALHQASTDSRIKALMIQPRGISVGWGRLQELREEILDFKKAGKPVYAYLQGAGSLQPKRFTSPPTTCWM